MKTIRENIKLKWQNKNDSGRDEDCLWKAHQQTQGEETSNQINKIQWKFQKLNQKKKSRRKKGKGGNTGD